MPALRVISRRMSLWLRRVLNVVGTRSQCSLSARRIHRFCENATGLQFATYNEFWEWSIADGLERFWELLWQWCEIEASEPYSQVLSTG